MKRNLIFILLIFVALLTGIISMSDSKKSNLDSYAVNVDAKSFGAVGNGIADDTASIQKAINYASSNGGGTVMIPDGTYLIDADVSIRMMDNISLNLSSDAVLKTKPTGSGTYYTISALNVSNIEIKGGKILGDRKEHLGSTGEWGHGIRIANCSNVRITDVSISDFWGDGIYIGAGYTDTPGEVHYSSDVTIERCYVDNSRRDGISIISVKNLLIKDCVLSNSNGTPPESGLVFEPNLSDEFMQNVVVENLKTINNASYGIAFNLMRVESSLNRVDITVTNFADTSSHNGAHSELNWFEQRVVVIK